MKSKEQKVLDAANAVEGEIETLVLAHLGEERFDIIQAISDALMLLNDEMARLNWLLGGENGATRNGRLSPIDQVFDEQFLVKTREDIDAEIFGSS